MKKIRVTILVSLIVVESFFLPIPFELPLLSPPKNALHVLFVGNSFTFGGDVPGIITELTAGRSTPIFAEMTVAGGLTMHDHLKRQRTIDAIRSRKWDWVVLQDCSICTTEDPSEFNENVPAMVNLVRKEGLKPVLFMTWADAGLDKDQKIISESYQKIGAQLNVPVVPVGDAWQAIGQVAPELHLHADDNHHASALGALLSGYVFASFFLPNETFPLMRERIVAPKLIYELLIPRRVQISDLDTVKLFRNIAREIISSRGPTNDIRSSSYYP